MRRITTFVLLFALSASAAELPYRRVLARTAGMVDNERAWRLVNGRGLDLVNVMWEDTGRYYGSAVGPNISDVTIQVHERYGAAGKQRMRTWLMPVIRYPNFSDKTGDVPIDRIQLLVGNERGAPLQAVGLRELLGDLRKYLHAPGSWKGERTSLLAKRDSHVLVSAQAAFLPLPTAGDAEATFNPVIFNYQSTKRNPAVLTILATREGTSVTVVDNNRDAFDAGGVWGQRLFFNANGQRASLTGKRESDFVAANPNPSTVSPTLGDEGGLNMVMIIQVPLKYRTEHRPMMAYGGLLGSSMDDGGGKGGEESRGSDVENAVIGHGALEGDFTELDGLAVARDPRFPVRVTVQFYKATSNGVIDRADVTAIRDQIRRVYKDADYVGSLVTQGYTGRPTEWDGDHTEPADWWRDFWQRYSADTGLSQEDVMRLMQERVYPRWAAAGGAKALCLPDPRAELTEPVLSTPVLE